MKISDHAVSAQAVEQGEWVDDIPGWSGLRLKTRGAENRDWRILNVKLIGEVPRHKRLKGLLPEDQDRISSTLLLECGLLDWEGPEDDEGKPLPFSKAQAKEYLTNPDYKSFRDACMYAATVVGERRAEDVETTAKN